MSVVAFAFIIEVLSSIQPWILLSTSSDASWLLARFSNIDLMCATHVRKSSLITPIIVLPRVLTLVKLNLETVYFLILFGLWLVCSTAVDIFQFLHAPRRRKWQALAVTIFGHGPSLLRFQVLSFTARVFSCRVRPPISEYRAWDS